MTRKASKALYRDKGAVFDLNHFAVLRIHSDNYGGFSVLGMLPTGAEVVIVDGVTEQSAKGYLTRLEKIKEGSKTNG